MKLAKRFRAMSTYPSGRLPDWVGGGGSKGLFWPRSPAQNSRYENFNEENALQLAPLLGCVGLFGRAASGTTLVVEERVGGEWRPVKPGDSGIPQWADPMSRPDVWQSLGEFLTAIMWNLLVGGTSNLWIKSRSFGFPANVQAVPNRAVQITGGTGSDLVGVTVSGGPPTYRVANQEVSLYTSLDRSGDLAQLRLFTRDDITRGESPIMVGAPSLRAAIAAEASAEILHASGGMPPTVWAAAATSDVNELKRFRADFRESRADPMNRHLPAVVRGDLKAITPYISPEQAQLIDSRRLGWDAVAAIYATPKSMFGGGTGSGTAGRSEQRAWAAMTAVPTLDLIAEGLLSELLPDDARVLLIPKQLLHGEPIELIRYLQRGVTAGLITPNEGRQELGLAPIDGLDEAWQANLFKKGGKADSADNGRDGSIQNNLEDANKGRSAPLRVIQAGPSDKQ